MNRLILGIDPGTTESGVCLIEAKNFHMPNILKAEKLFNSNVQRFICESVIKCHRLEVVIEGMSNQSRALASRQLKHAILSGGCLNIAAEKTFPSPFTNVTNMADSSSILAY